MKDFYVSAPQDLQAFLIALELRPGLNRRTRRRFFNELRRVLLLQDRWCGSYLDLCMIVCEPHECVQTRHIALAWLIDQVEVQVIYVHCPRSLLAFAEDFEVVSESGASFFPAQAASCRSAILKALGAALLLRRAALALKALR